MPRIAGIDVPEKKKIYFALQYIHGIGPFYSRKILDEAGVNPDLRANELEETQTSKINEIIDATYVVEGAKRREVQQNIQRLKDIKCYRGERHRKGLPTRGQRTRSNARTRKGKKKTVAGKKGVKAKG